MSVVEIFILVRREHAGRYHKHLSTHKDFRTTIFFETKDVLEKLADQDQDVDALVIDNGLDSIVELVDEVRHSFPRLFVVLVDEEADFGMPGYADEISTTPFTDNDLINRITKLMSDRRLETLRADSLPAVRKFAKELRNAPGELGKLQTTVGACKNIGFDYVALYRKDKASNTQMVLAAQTESNNSLAEISKALLTEELLASILQADDSRIISLFPNRNDALLQAIQPIGAVACIPVLFSGTRYGVLAAVQAAPDSIASEKVLELELMVAQLGSAISKELVG